MEISIEFKGLEFVIAGDYTPGEPAEMYDRNGEPGHPGSNCEFDIETIYWNGNEVKELIENLIDLSDLDELIFEKINEDNEE